MSFIKKRNSVHDHPAPRAAANFRRYLYLTENLIHLHRMQLGIPPNPYSVTQQVLVYNFHVIELIELIEYIEKIEGYVRVVNAPNL